MSAHHHHRLHLQCIALLAAHYRLIWALIESEEEDNMATTNRAHSRSVGRLSSRPGPEHFLLLLRFILLF